MLFLFCLKHKKYLNSENFAVEACTRNNYRARTAAKPTANELFAARAKYSVIVVIKVRYWNIYGNVAKFVSHSTLQLKSNYLNQADCFVCGTGSLP
jgi:hypothetical protein